MKKLIKYVYLKPSTGTLGVDKLLLTKNSLQVHKNFIMVNEYNSAKLCEGLYTRCEDKMDQLQVLRLPSMAKFNAGFLQCNRSFEKECVGPSKTSYENRMMKVFLSIFF